MKARTALFLIPLFLSLATPLPSASSPAETITPIADDATLTVLSADSLPPLPGGDQARPRTQTADSLDQEHAADEGFGFRAKLRRRIHVLRVLIDVMLGILERGIGAAEMSRGA